MKAGLQLEAATAGWPRTAAVLLLLLPGCAATNSVRDKTDYPPPPPDHIRDVNLAARHANGTVTLCISDYSARVGEWSMTFKPLARAQRAASTDKKNRTDHMRPGQPVPIPRQAVPVEHSARGCLYYPSQIPIHDMLIHRLPGNIYKVRKIDPAYQKWGVTDRIPQRTMMSDIRLRAEIRDVIIAHEAPAGIYKLAVALPDSGHRIAAVFYKQASASPGTARVIQIEISHNPEKKQASSAARAAVPPDKFGNDEKSDGRKG